MSNSPAKTPDYLSLKATSPWHISALQVAGVESMTISSRLRNSLGGRGTLQDLEDTVNSTSKRRIAKFGMTIADPDTLSHKASERIVQAENTVSMTSQQTSEDSNALASFDIDIFTRYYRSINRSEKKEHIFGRAEALRGDWAVRNDGGRDPYDRSGMGPSVQRYVNGAPLDQGFVSGLLRGTCYSSALLSPLVRVRFDSYSKLSVEIREPKSCTNVVRYIAPVLFPLLDSFPSSIFDAESSGHATKLAVHAGLTTSTAVAAQIRALEQIARRLTGIDEREALCNGLHVLAEEYDEGWDSGMDSDNDD